MGCTGSKNTKAAAAAADAQPGGKTLLEGQAPAEKQPEPAASVAPAAQPEPAADAAAAAQPEVVAAPEAAVLAEAAPEEAAKIAAPAASEAVPATTDAQEAAVDAPLPAVAEQTEDVKEVIDAPTAASNSEVPKAEAVETTEAIAVQTASEETAQQAIEPKTFVFPFNFNICCGPQPVIADDSIPEPQDLRPGSGPEVTASE